MAQDNSSTGTTTPNNYTTNGSFSHYMGPLSSIPSTSSPGFRFLKLYIPAIDALDRESPEALRFNEILAPGATFLTNVTGAWPVTREYLEVMLQHRELLLSRFTHEDVDIQAYDILHASGNRTVIVETVSTSVFKADPNQEHVRVNEMIAIELMKSRVGRPWGGFIAFAVRTYMDSTLMAWKTKQVFGLGDDGLPVKTAENTASVPEGVTA